MKQLGWVVTDREITWLVDPCLAFKIHLATFKLYEYISDFVSLSLKINGFCHSRWQCERLDEEFLPKPQTVWKCS